MSAIIQGKLCFIHIPRTAGTSVIHWLEQNNIEHVRDVTHPSQTMITEDYEQSFAIVRNPWDRCVSMYSHLQKRGFLWEALGLTTEEDLPTWDKFLTDYLRKIYWFTTYTNQVEWIPNSVDILLRYETLNNDFKQVQELVNCHEPLPHVNYSAHSEYKSYYSTEQQKLVSNLFEQDIDMFKYQF